jgi:phosphopantothenoylcysteine decarboxylase/phosphopantothenate--cysteine ligase
VQLCVAASADLIARLALGLADDAVTTTALACRAPMVIAPAMETAMWEHPATVAHVETLRRRGAVFAGPVPGRLASGRQGIGRMAEPADIVEAAVAALH